MKYIKISEPLCGIDGKVLMEEVKDEKGEMIKQPIEIRRLFLNFLSRNFEYQDIQEVYWVREFGIKCADNIAHYLEVNDIKKYNFLKRIFENNIILIKTFNHLGQEMAQDTKKHFFEPYLLGQILTIIDEAKDTILDQLPVLPIAKLGKNKK